MEDEIFDIVDKNDKVLYQERRSEVIAKKLRHRSIQCFIMNSQKELFVHQRTFSKQLYPGYYDICVSGGVKTGENYYECVKREILEEVGLFGKMIRFLFDLEYNSPELNYIGKIYLVKHDGKMKLQKEEIIDGKFMKIEEIDAMIAQGEKFCPDSIITFERFKKLMKEGKV